MLRRPTFSQSYRDKEQISSKRPMTATKKISTIELLSRILELEFGNSRLQHYGLFDEDSWLGKDEGNLVADGSATTDELLLAQYRFKLHLLETIKQRIEGDASILIVGDTLLPLAQETAATGISTLWLGSGNLVDEKSSSLRHFRSYQGDLPGFTEQLKLDLVVLQGSFHYLDQMALLSKCRDLLAADAQLLLFGEFLDDDSQIEYSSLPNLSSFKQLSRRLGFRLLEEFDATASASRTLELVRPILERNIPQLLNDKIADAAIIGELQLEFSRMQQEFMSGRRCFRVFMLDLEPEVGNEWSNAEFGDIHSFHPHEIAQLFEKSFNASFNEDLWNWKYRLGNGKCVTARLSKSGEIVAHYGGAPRNIMYFGVPSMAIQPCDVMVLPDIRKQYGKGSLFFEVAATFLEREIGNTVNHLLGFGFPNQKTMNMSKRLGLYEKTDDFIEIEYAPVVSAPLLQELKCESYLHSNDTHNGELDALWLQMSEAYQDGIIGVRNSDYIKYRYITHPFARANLYQCLIIREADSGKATAIAVLKDHSGGKLLMDLICPTIAIKPVIAQLIQELSSSGEATSLKFWVTKSALGKVLLDDAIVNELGIEIPCNSWNPGPSSEILVGAWWLTAGDMDFV